MSDHQWTTEGKQTYCTICNTRKTRSRTISCPGVPVIWKAWDNWDEHVLPLMTKTQLQQAGYKTTAKHLPEPVAAVPAAKKRRKVDWYYLYDPAQCVKRDPATPEQLARLAKAQGVAADERWLAQHVEIRCVRCGIWRNGHLSNLEYLEDMQKFDEWLCTGCRKHKRLQPFVRRWARIMLASDNVVVLDSETTGLAGAEIIEVAIIDQTGKTLFNQRVKPDKPIEPGAFAVHGISDEMLKNEPSFDEIYPALAQVVNGKHLLIYNVDFDLSILNHEAKKRGLPVLQPVAVTCVMEMYAIWRGDWSKYHQSFRWQPLEGGDHTALGDCMATLDVVMRMARDD